MKLNWSSILLVFILVSITVQILLIVYGIKGSDVSFVTGSLKLFVILIDITSFDITSFGMTYMAFDLTCLYSIEITSVHFSSVHFTTIDMTFGVMINEMK